MVMMGATAARGDAAERVLQVPPEKEEWPPAAGVPRWEPRGCRPPFCGRRHDRRPPFRRLCGKQQSRWQLRQRGVSLEKMGLALKMGVVLPVAEEDTQSCGSGLGWPRGPGNLGQVTARPPDQHGPPRGQRRKLDSSSPTSARPVSGVSGESGLLAKVIVGLEKCIVPCAASEPLMSGEPQDSSTGDGPPTGDRRRRNRWSPFWSLRRRQRRQCLLGRRGEEPPSNHKGCPRSENWRRGGGGGIAVPSPAGLEQHTGLSAGRTKEKALRALDDDGLAVFLAIPEENSATLQDAYKKMSAVYDPPLGPRDACKRAKPCKDGLGWLHRSENLGLETNGPANHPRLLWSHRKKKRSLRGKLWQRIMEGTGGEGERRDGSGSGDPGPIRRLRRGRPGSPAKHRGDIMEPLAFIASSTATARPRRVTMHQTPDR
ncbi:unnamed protein product [Lampetra fluviatilis]